MITTRTLASAMLAAFGAIGGRPSTGSAISPPNDATVISLSVVPRTGRADVGLGRLDARAQPRQQSLFSGVAGDQMERVDGAALAEVFRLSRGIPRVINVTCDRALLGATVAEMQAGLSEG